MYNENETVAIVERNEENEIINIYFEKITKKSARQYKIGNEVFDTNGIHKTKKQIYLSKITEDLKVKKEAIDKEKAYLFIKNECIVGESQRKFAVNDIVQTINGTKLIIDEVFDDGKFYGFKENNNYKVLPWINIVPYSDNNEAEFSIKDLEKISFYKQTISSLLHMVYYFGVDFNPDYQRDLVWTDKDKSYLIDSIFKNIEIGKFAFTQNEKYQYEIIDGKQRLTTLVDFYEDKFKFNGKLFSQLSTKDRNHFLDASVSVANIENISREQKLKYFLRLNTQGKVMDKNHLKKVENMLLNEKKCH